MQSAPYAVDVLEEMMENAVSEPVRLKAASEILDRAGVKGGFEFDINVEVTDARTPAQIVMERLARLKQGAENTAQLLAATTSLEDAEVIIDAEVQEDDEQILPTASAEVKNTGEDESVESQEITAEELDEL
jgi:hypothetical protein